MKSPQRRLQISDVVTERHPVTYMKAFKLRRRRHWRKHGGFRAGRSMALQQAVLCINHRDFLADGLAGQARRTQHILQAQQAFTEVVGGDLKKPGAFACLGGSIHLSAVRLNPTHQPPVMRPALTAGKKQVLQQMRESRPALWLVMAACLHFDQRRRLGGVRLVAQRYVQSIELQAA